MENIQKIKNKLKMKDILLKIFILGSILICSAFTSCSDEDDPFSGTDNYITSFSLIKDGIAYKGAIVNDKIQVDIIKSVDITGIKAEYELSELAVISPDPSTVTHWEEKMEFTVTSHNNSSRVYTLQINRTETPAVSSVTLLTQTDVDNFAASNVEFIDGDLIIGANVATTEIDSIKNLNGLLNLKKIANNLVVNNTFGAVNFDGLKNLESVGNIYMKKLTTRKVVEDSLDIELPKLATAGEIYVNSDLLRSITLPSLKSAFSFYVNGKSLSIVELPMLETVLSDFTIQSGTNSSVNTTNQKLQNIIIGKLKTVGGAMSLRGLLASNDIQLPLLESVGSNLSIEYLSNLQTIDASSLKTIGQTFTLKGLDAMETLSMPELLSSGAFIYSPNNNKEKLAELDLPKVEGIKGDFKIERSKLTTLNLPAIKEISGALSIAYSSLLTAINVPELSVCQKVYLSSVPLITSLDISKIKNLNNFELVACYKLAKVKSQNIDKVTLNGGSTLCDFTKFEGLESISESLSITNYTKNSDINFPGIKHIGKYSQTQGMNGETIIDFPDLETIKNLTITSASYLKKFNAPKLTTVSEIWNTSNMTNISSGDIHIPKLKKIGTLKFYGGTNAGLANSVKLKDLNDFSNVTDIEKVEIKWWGNMIDFSGLKNAISKIKMEDWTVEGCAYNPTYEQMKNGEYIKP